MAITLPVDTETRALDSIKRFLQDEMEMEVGNIQARFLLEFFLKEIAPSVYNQAIIEAQAYFQDKTADLAGTCYREEFTYRKNPQHPRRGK